MFELFAWLTNSLINVFIFNRFPVSLPPPERRITMNEPRRYRLGNQPEEYEVSEDYLGWKPGGFKDWYDAITDDDNVNRRPRPFPLILVSPDNTQTVSIIVHQPLIKDAFPLHFFGEERSKDWSGFAKISLEVAPWDLFIIPLH